MVLEKYVDQGILLERVYHASKRVPITFHNGTIKVGKEVFGMHGCPYAIDVVESAIELADTFIA